MGSYGHKLQQVRRQFCVYCCYYYYVQNKSGYYSYLWSEVISCALFAEFERKGDFLDPELGMKLRKTVLVRRKENCFLFCCCCCRLFFVCLFVRLFLVVFCCFDSVNPKGTMCSSFRKGNGSKLFGKRRHRGSVQKVCLWSIMKRIFKDKIVEP